jgi:hypothetical protein
MVTGIPEVSDLKINTLSVELKMVNVNKKQMTLSVFRQIPEKSFLKDDLTYRGIPWGWVNYFWNPPERDTKVDSLFLDPLDKIHLLWQKENKLYRHPLYFYDKIPLIKLLDSLRRNLSSCDIDSLPRFLREDISRELNDWEKGRNTRRAQADPQEDDNTRMEREYQEYSIFKEKAVTNLTERIAAYLRLFVMVKKLDQLFIAVS